MIESIEFAKLSGSGNDFICIDNREGRYDQVLGEPHRIGHLARSLCDRGKGIGSDGVIFACAPEIEGVSDIAARFFEADGSETELCGNGIGCFVQWAVSGGWIPESGARILTSAGVVRGSDSDGRYIRVCIPDPADVRLNLELTVKGRVWRCDFAVTGVPHLITYVEDVNEVDIEHWGPVLRHHEKFQPRGVNANFVQVLSEGELALRTWEFGVEGETLACGTGSAAAAILAVRRFRWAAPDPEGDRGVLVRARSGDLLRVFFAMTDDGTASDVCLETVVRFLCTGTVHPDLAAVALDARAAAQSSPCSCRT